MPRPRPHGLFAPLPWHDDYYRAFGQFVDAFNRVENHLSLYLIHRVGVQEEFGKALLVGKRALGLIKDVRLVWKIQPPDAELKAELDRILRQLKAINTERNKIIHQTTLDDGRGERMLTNMMRAPLVNIQRAKVSVDHLDAMTDDLYRMMDHLFPAWKEPMLSAAQRKARHPDIGDPWQFIAPQKEKSPKRAARNARRDQRKERRAKSRPQSQKEG